MMINKGRKIALYHSSEIPNQIFYLCSLDDLGEMEYVTFNGQARAMMMTAPVEKIQSLYRAMRKMNDYFYDEDIHITLKLNPGVSIQYSKQNLGKESGQP